MVIIKTPFAAGELFGNKAKTGRRERKDRLFMEPLSSTDNLKEIHIVLYMNIRFFYIARLRYRR
jgi:hypothetical protein